MQNIKLKNPAKQKKYSSGFHTSKFDVVEHNETSWGKLNLNSLFFGLKYRPLFPKPCRKSAKMALFSAKEYDCKKM
jgi:hypothetical protein